MKIQPKYFTVTRLPLLALLCAALAACGGSGSGTPVANNASGNASSGSGSSSSTTISVSTPPATITTTTTPITTVMDTVGNGGTIIDTLPTDVGVDGAGNMYVSVVNQQQVTKITPAGVLTSYIANTGATVQYDLGAPGALAVDPQGDVYVVSGDNIVEVTPSGQISTPYQISTVYAALPNTYIDQVSDSYGPSHFAVDNSGNLYITVECSGIVRKVTPSGAMTTIASGLGIQTSQFLVGGEDGFVTQCTNGANGIAVDSAGNVYASDTLNGAVLMIHTSGAVTTLAGGTAFTAPGALSVDANGNVYVIDQGLVKMISPQGAVKTLVGYDAGSAPVLLPNASAPDEYGAGAALAFGPSLYVFSGYSTDGWALVRFDNLLP